MDTFRVFQSSRSFEFLVKYKKPGNFGFEF